MTNSLFLKFFFFWCGPFLKSLLNLLQYCLCFAFFFFGHKACGILAPWSGIEPTPPTLEGEILTTVPPGKSYKFSFRSQFPPHLLALLNLTFFMNKLYFRTSSADIKPFCKSFSLLGKNNKKKVLSFHLKGFILVLLCCMTNYLKTW